MRQLISGPRAAEDQLALDEALLVRADESEDESPTDHEWLRVWQFESPTLVLGRSSKFLRETNEGACRAAGVPILRRCSGGAAIVGGPGCLMYSLVLSLERRPELRKIDAAHRLVMGRMVGVVGRQLSGVRFDGTCDLTWRGRKFSGNSLKVGRRSLLYHGTFLIGADLALIAHCLGVAPRQPEYRRGRAHGEFVTNVPLCPDRLESDLAEAWGVARRVEGLDPALEETMRRLRQERYGRQDWHRRH